MHMFINKWDAWVIFRYLEPNQTKFHLDFKRLTGHGRQLEPKLTRLIQNLTFGWVRYSIRPDRKSHTHSQNDESKPSLDSYLNQSSVGPESLIQTFQIEHLCLLR